MIPKEIKKNTMVWRINPKAVGQPSLATPGMMLFTKRKVTGLATKKKMRVEYNENLAFNPVDNAIYIVEDLKR